ncbi:MAG: hypothetical protein IKN48_06640 [Bacteroidaceae bacterium]|nr:hypothetical protein [Bacteroidaceae bacterium]
MWRRFNETLVRFFLPRGESFPPSREKNFSSGGKNEVVIPLKASAAIPLSPPHKHPLNPQINNLLKNILKVFVDFCGELWGIV